MVGIVSYGAYIPIYRLSRQTVAQVWGGAGGKSERAVANADEDTITMAVEACMDAMKGKQHTADGLYFASTTPPYREKQCASIVAAALDFPVNAEFSTADFTNSFRSGTSALKIAYEQIKGKSAKKIIVAAAELRRPAPNTESEQSYGDGAAAFIIGDENVAAEIEGSYATYSEFMDTWRRDNDKFARSWEDRYIFEEGYDAHFPVAIKGLLAKLKLKNEDFTKFVLYAPDARRHTAMAGTLKIDPKKVQAPMFDTVGHTGCACLPMMLVAALEEAKPGDRILVANYSDGADAFSLKVTDEIEKIRNRRGIKGYLKSKSAFPNYGKYIIFRDLMEFEAERRADFSALSHYMRERNQFLRFHGGRCKSCGTLQHPIQRVCAVCQAKDNYVEERLAETTGNIFSFAMDERAMVKDLPNVFVIVDLDGGGRYAGVLTDRIPSEVKVGMKVEMTLRNQHDGAGFHNYSWKARPVRA